jgi:hypothetical protein
MDEDAKVNVSEFVSSTATKPTPTFILVVTKAMKAEESSILFLRQKCFICQHLWFYFFRSSDRKPAMFDRRGAC